MGLGFGTELIVRIQRTLGHMATVEICEGENQEWPIHVAHMHTKKMPLHTPDYIWLRKAITYVCLLVRLVYHLANSSVSSFQTALL